MSKPAGVTWWWLSFRDAGKNEWLGGCWIDAPPGADPIVLSHARGLNPGGEVFFVELEGDEPPPESQVGRLLQKGDLELARLDDVLP